jgi:RNA polymerase sigma-70 factor (ECF subfamily)
MEERQAIRRLQRGDLTGLEVLVRLYQVKAVQAAGLIVLDKALAEDIVQNSFLKAAEKIHLFDPERPFAPWFFRCVVNASIKAAKKVRRTVSLEEMDEDGKIDFQALMIDPQPGPEEWLEREEFRKQLWQGLDRLPPDQKAALVMRHFLDMSEAEMALQMHRPKSTIKYWLRVAREKLRQWIDPFSSSQIVFDERPDLNKETKGVYDEE